MNCAHCMMSATENGENMSIATVHAALKRCCNATIICLGGGEPTIHPKFWQIVNLLLRKKANGKIRDVGLVTNGKETKTALTLCKMAKEGKLGATFVT